VSEEFGELSCEEVKVRVGGCFLFSEELSHVKLLTTEDDFLFDIYPFFLSVSFNGLERIDILDGEGETLKVNTL